MASTIIDSIEKEIPRLRRFARCLTRDAERADDIVQQSLLRAVDKTDAWQPGNNLRTWLLALVRNCYIDEVNRARQRPVANDAALHCQWPGESQEQQIALGGIRDAFLRLEEEHREILLLVVVEGLDYQVAADILMIPVETVRSRLSCARQALLCACVDQAG
jgi:RNA polymerase sigma-70 factor, ECF subfamily